MKKRKDFRKYLVIFIIVLLIILVIILLGYFIPKINFSGKVVNTPNNAINSGSRNANIPVITKENFVKYAEKQNIVKDLPKNSLILLKFYNFNNGERIWEDSYIIQKASVKKGFVDNPDVTVIIHSKYIPETSDICSAIKKANKNKDLSYETAISDAKLLWKYGGMLKYKSCF